MLSFVNLLFVIPIHALSTGQLREYLEYTKIPQRNCRLSSNSICAIHIIYIMFSLQYQEGAHDPERATYLFSCNGVFTSKVIFRYAFPFTDAVWKLHAPGDGFLVFVNMHAKKFVMSNKEYRPIPLTCSVV